MRVAHLVQQHQRLLELGKPAMEHLFKEGGRANRAAQEREPRAHNNSQSAVYKLQAGRYGD